MTIEPRMTMHARKIEGRNDVRAAPSIGCAKDEQ
jgi:hypothetical protein